ncbi:DUF2283 domain-containing protein [Rhodopila sp.]|uniref:DUF2283 domain-containing protein n=1 Tax=Rhodopila sp. TaxID=2480087 RepID=UPI003D0DC379
MRLHHHPDTDRFYIALKSESGPEELTLANGVKLNFDVNGDVIGFDSDHASRRFNLTALEIVALALKTTRLA